jgi:hypothetical protein
VTLQERVTVGATLPGDVRLQPVPAEWGSGVAKYHYIYTDNHIVLIDPTTRRVVMVVD